MAMGSEDLQSLAAKGLGACRDGDWTRGVALLGEAAAERGTDRELPGVVYSFLGYGIAKYQRRVRDGLKLCEHAVKIQYYEPDNHLNLARVQLMTSDRKGAVASIARGLKLDPNHKGLKELRLDIGVRRRPVIPFLSRTNLLNQLFGRLRHKLTGR